MEQSKSKRLIGREEFYRLVPISRTQVWKLENGHAQSNVPFPKSVRVGQNGRRMWIEWEVLAYIDALAAVRDKAA